MEEFQQVLPVSSLSDEKRVAFYKKTYTHLAMAVLLFVIVEWFFFQVDAIVEFAFSMTQGFRWLIMLGGFMLATSFAERMAFKNHNINQQYLGLLLYVVAEAFIFIPLIGIAMMIAESGGREYPLPGGNSYVVPFYRVICDSFDHQKGFFVFEISVNYWIFYRFGIDRRRYDIWI